MIYTSQCNPKCDLTLRPVPGAHQWPRRLECKIHGYPSESHARSSISSKPEIDPPNHYVEEIASPADVHEIGGKEVSQY